MRQCASRHICHKNNVGIKTVVVTKEKYNFIQAVKHKSLEDDLKKWNTAVWQDKDLFFSKRISSHQVSILMIPSLVVASCASFVSVYSDVNINDSNPAVNFKTITVLSASSPSGPTAASSALCFHISRKLWSLSSWEWDFNNSKMSAAVYVQICALNLDTMSGGTLCKCGLM